MVRPRKQRDAGTTTSYDVEWQYDERLPTEHLGRQKYTTSARALAELVANALDAGGTRVNVGIECNKLGGIELVTVADNGRGMTPDEIRTRFMVVGVQPAGGGATPRLGRFGVGRFGVHRVGARSSWTTVSASGTNKRRCTFVLGDGTRSAVRVTETELAPETPTGTTVVIDNVCDVGCDGPTPARVNNELAVQFCSFLLGHPGTRVSVNDDELDIRAMVRREALVELSPPGNLAEGLRVRHLMLAHPVDRSRFPHQLLFTGKGRTVATVNLEQPPSTHYLGVVECPYLDSLVSANREGLVELDGTFARIRESALESVSTYAHEVGTVRRREFIERARAEEYYPYRAEPTDAVSDARRAIYDVVLDRVNEHANLEGMSKKQQAVVFRLLARALGNENLLEVLSEVARLSDEDIESFRRVLEKTTLESIVRLSSEVTERIHFLDVLNELVYGDVAKHVKERSQLHRILDSRCWVFGSQYHLASSDKSFRDVIQRHRAAAGLASVTDDQLADVEGVRDIPDLFFVAERDYPVEPKHWRLLVELKAPKVNAGRKELEQVRRYAERVHKANDLATPSTRWDVFLVTTGVKDEIERDRCQKDRLHGCAYDWGDLRVWVVKWSEVIQQARDEMALVRDHLKKKSEEISVSDFLRENFPDILAELGTHPPVTTDTADTQTRLPSPRGNRAGAEKR